MFLVDRTQDSTYAAHLVTTRFLSISGYDEGSPGHIHTVIRKLIPPELG